MKKDIIYLKNFLKKFVPEQINFRRLGCVFETQNNMYFYDAGTGKVIECNKNEYMVFKSLVEGDDSKNCGIEKPEDLDEAIENICKIAEEENLLQAPIYREFARETDQTIHHVTSEGFHQLILEVTQNCNFRCKYCVFNNYNENFRDFAPQNMKWDVAKKAIDYTKAHSGKSEEEVSISFYGGEPLINYELIKKVVEYSKKIMPDKKLLFAFTTNLSLMTRDKADFFAKEGFIILCSIDGPQEVHDAYRIDVKGDGTFNQALRGLKNLVEAYGDSAKDRILFNSVVTPPYSKKKFDAIKNFFENIDWLPPMLTKRFSYVVRDSLRKEDIDYSCFENDCYEGKDVGKKLTSVDPLTLWALENIIEDNDKDNISMDYDLDAFVRIQNRLILDRPYHLIKRNACCTPGGKRLFVRVDGTFHACERVGNVPDIGNVDNGLDLDKMKKVYIEEYEKSSLSDCSNCWAVHLCALCYSICMGEEGVDMERKRQVCESHREILKGDLVKYYQLMESRPDKLDYIQNASVR